MKFVLKHCLMLILLTHNQCYAQVMLRFQPEINDHAARLGDVLIIEKGPVEWANIPLDSHPTPNEVITKVQMIDWMTQRLEHFKYTWQGKTNIRVSHSSQTSGTLLVEKAKAALIHQLSTSCRPREDGDPSSTPPTYHSSNGSQLSLGRQNVDRFCPQYLHVDVTPLSHPKDSSYALNDIKVSTIHLSFPTPKRVCVWLILNERSKVPVWFKVNAYAKVLVANHDIHYNAPLDSNSFSLKKRNVAGLTAAPVITLPQDAGLKSSIERDSILLESQLKKTPLVTHGQHIKVATHNRSITVVMDALALSDGYLGETITVKNPLNQKTFDARISGFQQAEITL